MAYLSPPFILCPLSDRKDLVGMREDYLQNKALITIGKNIAIRYHILEQKQETSWTSSRHWITSPVVYCGDFKRYGAIIDHSVVALWEEEDTTLSQLKKLKFSDKIAELRPNQTFGTLVVFCNGTVVPLSQVDEKETFRRPVIDLNTEELLGMEIDESSNRVFVISGKSDGHKRASRSSLDKRYLLISYYLLAAEKADSPQEGDSREVTSVEIVLDEEEITGYCLIFQGTDTSLLYMCSDGFLYRKVIFHKENKNISLEKSERGFKVAYMAKYTSKANPVVMQVMKNSSSLIMYGCDPSEEGAVVFIYDVNYDLLLSKQSLKLYASPPIMNVIGQSVFVPVGLHILVMNFQLKQSLLASVVGQHQLGIEEEAFVDRDPWGVKSWEIDAEQKESAKLNPKSIDLERRKEEKRVKEEFPKFYETITLVKALESDGQSELVICQQAILPAVNSKNFDAIEWLLDYFDDIPEMFLVKIAALYLEQLKPISSSDDDPKINGPLCNGNPIGEENANLETSNHLNNVLQRKFDSLQLTKSLRTIDFLLAKRLLLYVTLLMETSWPFTSDGEPNAAAWLKWISAILDAHYTKFVFHNETELADKILNLIEEKSMLMKSIQELEPLLLMTVKKTRYEPGPSRNSKFRTETIEFI